ncbi:MAG: hypothetical protein ACOX3U_04160 [Christensenellales bacterium]|jgi:hypothetical protein
MLDYIAVHIRRLKWDIQYYIRNMWQDILILAVIVIFGIAVGITAAVKLNLVKECIFLRILSGSYSPVLTFMKMLMYNAITLAIISITGFFKLYRLTHCIIIFYWGYRFGLDIIAITTSTVGFISLIFIYIPFYLLSISIFISLILFIRIVLPSPRLNWWCHSPCFSRMMLRRCIILLIPHSAVNIIIFVINPIILSFFSIVI